MTERNALGARSLLPDDNPLNAGAPTEADAWRFNADWLREQRARSAQMGLLDPQTGLPTQAGWLDAANQYGNALMLGTTGPAGMPSLASRSARMYNLPNVGTAGTGVGAVGRAGGDVPSGTLLHDPEGRPLNAPYIAGIRESGSLAQTAISPEELNAVSTAAFGTGPEGVAARVLRQDVGRFRREVDPVTGERGFHVYYDKNLPTASRDMVIAHEIGHGLDEIAGKIPTEGLDEELRHVYNLQNNPQTYGRRFGPEQNRYSGKDDIDRELMAEGIRGYMSAPEAFKKLAPKVAAAIRAAINAHPTLSKVIQFNAAGGLAYGAMSASDQPTN